MAACLFDSCSIDDLAGQSAQQSQVSWALENAVSFDAYSQRSLTRSGDAGVLDNTALATGGFGVFAYKTDEAGYSEDATPNFMYNEHVTKSGSSWTYEPVKYWSNDYGSNAQSDEIEKFSFFAYAPYVANSPETGKVADDQLGITGLTRNSAKGDPVVKYVGSLDPTKCVDLCWGVVDPNQDVTWNIINGGSQTMAKGMPWMNVQRPQKSLGQKMKFVFKHALAQLNVQIDADVNTNEHGAGLELDANTKVFVRKVTFNGFAMRGALNLNNIVADQPLWLDYYGDGRPLQDEALTIYDGMRDGMEGTGKITAVESVTGLNPSIIQTKKWSEQAAADGVQKAAKNLFNAASADASVYVIPTGDEMKVTIEYDIETADPKLLAYTVSDDETHGTSIPYKETRTVTLNGDATQKLILEAGKKHTVRLHLGVNTVMFDAEVSDWDMTNVTDWMPDIVVATGITLNKTATEFFVAEQEQLIATVMPVDVTDDRVSWTTSDATIATVGADGIVHGVAPGTVTITATNSAGQTATCEVTVKAIPATGITLDRSSLEMNIVDADVTLVATVTPADATYKDVTWTSSDPAVATVDANGKVHPVGDGTATITATVTAYPTLTATCSVTVVSDPGIPLAQTTSAHLGYYVGANGKAYQTKALANHYSSAQAWIAYKNGTHGLAIALTNDAPGGTSWNGFAANPGWNSTPSRAAISGGTWRWPTKTDFENMLPRLKTLSPSGNGIIDSSDYWSSTENGAYNAWFLLFAGSSSGVYDDRKDSYTSYSCVRAVLAF